MSKRHAAVETTPQYAYQCDVERVVNANRLDVLVDMGLEIRTTHRVVLADVDSVSRFPDHDAQRSEEYTDFTVNWVREAQETLSGAFPFIVQFDEYDRHGPSIADVYSSYHESWLSSALTDEFRAVVLG